MSDRKTLVTSALIYANGSVHLGHLVEYLQTDIFVRGLRALGEDVTYVCADDTHGTPIELKALELKIPPEQLIAAVHKEHVRDFADFHIAFDQYYTTNSPENRAYANDFYAALQRGGHIVEKATDQAYCEKDKRFLPDRYVRGTCPKCGALDQYGDACEVCRSTYEPTELVEPRCALCGTKPLTRSSVHQYVRLADFAPRLRAWLESANIQPDVRNYVMRWLDDGLKDWCISRDGPYFGFEIPGHPGKFFYVWLDAPIGYISSTAKYCADHGLDVATYWKSHTSRIVHVIGKDIVYFHTLFWPAMLMAAGYTLPDTVAVHGMLTVNGQKMSKSRGTFINARAYLNHLDPQYLRFYYASKLGDSTDDLDLSFEDFKNKVEADLVNKIVNLFSRVVPFVTSRLDGRIGALPASTGPQQAEIRAAVERAGAAYRDRRLADAVREAVRIAEIGNKFVQDQAPWALMATDPEKARAVCTFGVNVCKAVAMVIAPVLPKLATDAWAMLAIAPANLKAPLFDLENRKIGEARRLVERLDPKAIEAMLNESKPSETAAAPAPAQASGDTITYDDFAKLKLKIGIIRSAEPVPKADRLLCLQVDVGEGSPRQLVAGIAQAYKPEQLVGRRVVVLVNLQPAKIKGVESHGMILAAGPGGADIQLLAPDAEPSPGTIVK